MLKPSGQPWHHFTPSIYGSSQARWATLADGLDDVVAAGVHHERFLPTLLDTGHSPTEGDDAEGVHQERILPPVLDIGRLLAEEPVLDLGHLLAVQDLALLMLGDAEGVVQDLALLTGPFALDATGATLDTALVRFLMHFLFTRWTSALDTALVRCVPMSAWPGRADSTMRCPRAMG